MTDRFSDASFGPSVFGGDFGALVVPSITVTQFGGCQVIQIDNGGADVDYNKLYRSGGGEYGGAYILISSNVEQDGSFCDYHAAHGVLYSYYVDAVSGSDMQASATESGTLTLSSAWIDAADKYMSGANAQYALAILDLIPQQQAYSYPTQAYMVGNATRPVIGQGTIESGLVSFTAIVRIADLADFTTIERIFRSSKYVCLRDVKGNKWFGRVQGYTEAYSHGFTRFPFALEVLVFDERVAA